MTQMRRSSVFLLSAMVLVAGASACSSSKKGASDSSASTTVAAGVSNGSNTTVSSAKGSVDPTKIDACSLYSKDDMAKQMGATDVTATSSTGVSPKCTYTSKAHYLEVELSVLTEDQFANTPRNPNAYLSDTSSAKVTLLTVSGIGDEVFGNSSKGGVSLTARKGKVGYSLLLTNAGGGPDAANWPDEAAMVTSAKAIMTAVVAK